MIRGRRGRHGAPFATGNGTPRHVVSSAQPGRAVEYRLSDRRDRGRRGPRPTGGRPARPRGPAGARRSNRWPVPLRRRSVVAGGTPPGGSQREPVNRRTPPATRSATCAAPNSASDARPTAPPASRLRRDSLGLARGPAVAWRRGTNSRQRRGDRCTTASGINTNPIQAWIVRTVHEPTERMRPPATQANPPTTAAIVASDRNEASATLRQRLARMARGSDRRSFQATMTARVPPSTPWIANSQASAAVPIRSDASPVAARATIRTASSRCRLPRGNPVRCTEGRSLSTAACLDICPTMRLASTAIDINRG